MPRIMTKAQHLHYSRLMKLERIARDEIFRVVDKMNVPFNKCYEAAPRNLQKAFCDTKDRRIAFEHQMIFEQRAWFDTNGCFHPHY